MNQRPPISFTHRARYLTVVTVTLLPVVAFMLVFFLTSFWPVFQSMERIVDQGYNYARPIHELEVALLNAAMPPNDHLIHGSANERQEWEMAKILVEKSFSEVLSGPNRTQHKDFLLDLQQRWLEAKSRGDALFEITSPVRHQPTAEAMESFDAAVYGISDRMQSLGVIIEQELHEDYQRVETLKTHGVIFAVLTILTSLVSGAAGSIWMTRIRSRMINLSLTDPLTGIRNRRALETELDRMEGNSIQPVQNACYSILLLDVDHFKSINDDHGHDSGDLALKAVAHLISSSIRSRDVFGRYGGEEFLVLLPDTRLDKAQALAERIRQKIESTPIQLPGTSEPLRMTVSIGCASNAHLDIGIKQIVRKADQAMYEAKQSGRNRTVCRS